MKRAGFYLAAVTFHLLVLYGMKAPVSEAAPVKVEQKYLEINLADFTPAEPPAPLPVETPPAAPTEAQTPDSNPDSAVLPPQPTQEAPAVAGDSTPASPGTPATPAESASPDGSASPEGPATPAEPASPPVIIEGPPTYPEVIEPNPGPARGGNANPGRGLLIGGGRGGLGGGGRGGGIGNGGGGGSRSGGGGIGRGGVGGGRGGGGSPPPVLPVHIIGVETQYGPVYTTRSAPQQVPQPEGGPIVMMPATGANPAHYFQAFSIGTGIDWAQAQAFAAKIHGYLAVINSAEVNTFVYQLVANLKYWRDVAGPFQEDSMGPWLGGVQAANSTMTVDGWSWSDGSQFTYSNWAAHTFNQNSNDENHLHFYGAGERNPQPTWNGSPSGSRASGFVVEYNGDPTVLNE